MNKTTDSITRYIAGVTHDGMVLWSVGYFIGAVIALLSSFTVLIISTFVLTVLFGVAKLYSEKKHGRRVNVTLSEQVIQNLPSD